jgi:uncharacterized membrane protein
MRRRAAAALFALVWLVALPAGAQSYRLPEADVDVRVESDGSVTVTERITYDFDGAFTGGYREIPLAAGESMRDVAVSEGSAVYQGGACTDLGCEAPAGTFGVRDLGGLARIVWHYEAADEARTFEIRYTIEGLANIYDDYVDVYLQVWGPEWEVGLDRLSATMAIPAGATEGDVYVWGHPATVGGRTELGESGVEPRLEASGIPPGQFVEFRVAFPRPLLLGSEGGTTLPGNGLPFILQQEEQTAQAADEQAARIRNAVIWGAAAAIVPGLAAALVVYILYGREPGSSYDRTYEQEPPDGLPPAEVAALVTQGKVDERGFTATLFDFISRGIIRARPIQTVRPTFLGLRNEQISDLELELGDDPGSLTAYERHAYNVLKRVLDEGPQPLHEFRSLIREDARANAKTYRLFADEVPAALERRKLLERTGRRVVVLVAVAFFAAAGIGVFLTSVFSGSLVYDGLVPFAISLGLIVSAILFLAAAVPRRVNVRRTRAGAEVAARWEAFRRYLSDFSRLGEAPSISLALWDRYLVYGVAFGVASEVLDNARLHAPPELVEQSNIYWYGSHGYGGGSSENAFAGLESALSGAFSPPGSSGGGGSFSGGGGGGGGGGSGGAW